MWSRTDSINKSVWGRLVETATGMHGFGGRSTPLAHTRARARLAIAANIAKLPELVAKGGSSGDR